MRELIIESFTAGACLTAINKADNPKFGPVWMDGWMDGKAILRIAYSNQKFTLN